MDSEIWIVVSTVDRDEAASRLARESVLGGRAACAQVEAAMISHYVWKGQAEESREVRLVFKTPGNKVRALMDWLRKEHPYEVPEILAWKVDAADPDYRNWMVGT